jgi:adenylate kinase
MTTIIITGTPGTGKTSVSKILADKLSIPLIAVNDLVDQKHIYTGYNRDKGYKEVDLDDLSEELKHVVEASENKGLIIEGHLSHHFKYDELIDNVIILRARPDILTKRLKTRNWSDSKIHENIEAEALDICTFEAVERYDNKVNEIDTTNITMQEVANQIIAIITGEISFPPGNLNFLEYLYQDDGK